MSNRPARVTLAHIGRMTYAAAAFFIACALGLFLGIYGYTVWLALKLWVRA